MLAIKMSDTNSLTICEFISDFNRRNVISHQYRLDLMDSLVNKF